MGKYLVTASYTAEGAKGLIADGGTARRKAVDALAASVGGTIEAFYYCFGGNDIVLIADAPNDEAMAAICMTVGASGGASCETTVLLSPAQIDAATKLSPAYRPPGS